MPLFKVSHVNDRGTDLYVYASALRARCFFQAVENVFPANPYGRGGAIYYPGSVQNGPNVRIYLFDGGRMFIKVERLQ